MEDSRGWRENYWSNIDKRFVWISTLFVNATKRKDMAEVLKYPLTPAPLCLSHVNDSVKEIWHNCSAHRSALLFIIDISSHCHVKRKQPQRIFLTKAALQPWFISLKNICHGKFMTWTPWSDVLMILSHKHKINILWKIACYIITTGGCFRFFVKFSTQSFNFLRN